MKFRFFTFAALVLLAYSLAHVARQKHPPTRIGEPWLPEHQQN